jgi:hypothetical protein
MTTQAEALQQIKALVVGSNRPNWAHMEARYAARAQIADICDLALAALATVSDAPPSPVSVQPSDEPPAAWIDPGILRSLGQNSNKIVAGLRMGDLVYESDVPLYGGPAPNFLSLLREALPIVYFSFEQPIKGQELAQRISAAIGAPMPTRGVNIGVYIDNNSED